MSCEACEVAQAQPKSAFYRWRTANIEVRGCEEHLREVFAALNLISGRSDLQGVLADFVAERRPVVTVKTDE